MANVNRHEALAREYWETYRPQALAELGSPQEQDAFFRRLGLRVMERIGTTADELLAKVPAAERGQARAAVRGQAQELVYEQEIFLDKEPGTEHREM